MPPAARSGDRSVPRVRVAAGDRSIDRRGRRRAGPAFLRDGFRPFFLLGALWAGLAVPAWVFLFLTGREPAGPFPGLAWHVHEMLFGYLAAVIAGFVLTAIPNWTGRLPLSGPPLAALVALWAAGRAAVLLVPQPLSALAVDLAFPLVLAASVWREILAGRNFRNLPVAILVSLFGAANPLHHLGELIPWLAGYGERAALATAAMLIALVGGRIVPSFTRNWLVRRGAERLPAGFEILDRLALVSAAIALAAWIAAPEARTTGLLLVLAGMLHLVRIARWRGLATWRSGIVLVLHLGALWLGIAFVLLGLSAVFPSEVPAGAALHALTAGAIATMTLAVMTRATLGHTGRPIETGSTTLAIYVLVTLGACLRVAAPFAGAWYPQLLGAGAAAWSASFLLFAIGYGPLLLRPRAGEAQKAARA
ncbi:NnrS family protein [Rhizobiales bacterium L72]|uniref:NnrS family protein n=2 Tax=Propylenella binzhouense TaxID=2555902 RepID=A0A964T6X1_9HYPH|nr:NnrS family protein [Propylenella binzhouense]